MKKINHIFLFSIIILTSSIAFAEETKEDVVKKNERDSQEVEILTEPVCDETSCLLPGGETMEPELAQAYLNPKVIGFPLNGHISQARYECVKKLDGLWMKENFKKHSYLCSSHKNRFSASFTTDKNNNIVVIRILFYDPKGRLNYEKELRRYRNHWSKLGVDKGQDVLFDTIRWSTQFLAPRGNKKDQYVIYCYNVVYASNL